MTINNAINNINRPLRNLCIAGNFSTNPWQRGTTFTSVSGTSVNTADMSGIASVGSGVFNILKTADAPTVAEAGILTQQCMHADVTTADASIAATDIYRLYMTLEGYDWSQIAQRTFTVSFWVKSTKTGIFCFSAHNSGDDRHYVAEFTVNSTDTWEYKTITISASPSAGTWDYTNGRGLQISWAMAAGSNFNTTAGAWQTGGPFYSTSNQVNGMDNTANNFKIALVQIEDGSIATSFEMRPVEDVLSYCQRYYFKTFAQGTTPATSAGTTGAIGYRAVVAGANINAASVPLPVIMRAAATVTYFNPSANNANWRNSSAAADSGAAATELVSDRVLTVRNPQAAGDAVQALMLIHATLEAAL